MSAMHPTPISDIIIPKSPASKSKKRRRSKIFTLFSTPKPEPTSTPSDQICIEPITFEQDNKFSYEPQIKLKAKMKTKRKGRHHRSSSSSSSSGSQFDKLKAIISSLFPKKSPVSQPSSPKPRKPKKSKPKRQRSNSFSFRRRNRNKNQTRNQIRNKNRNKNEINSNDNNKNNDKHKNNKQKRRNLLRKPRRNTTRKLGKKHQKSNSLTAMPVCWTEDDCNSDFEREIKKIKASVLEVKKEKKNEIDLSGFSETEEYKDEHEINGFSLSASKPSLAPKSSSFMRSYEKRPEYTTYYPPASLMEVFNNITVDEEERSVTMETKTGLKKGLSSVDQLFDLAGMTLDYGNFYGYLPDQNHQHQHHGNDKYDKLVVINQEINQEMKEHKSSLEYDTHDYELNAPTLDVSALSSLPDDEEYDENDIDCAYNLSWQ